MYLLPDKQSMIAFLPAMRKALLVMAALMLLSAASVIVFYGGKDERGHSGASVGVENVSELLRELLARSPGSRRGAATATKRPYPRSSVRQVKVAPPPAVQQRALGKIFDPEPPVPYFNGSIEREPFFFTALVADPVLGFPSDDLALAPSGPQREYGGNPPVYFVRPGSDGGGILPPAVMPVPEPATWCMLILGFGACGSALRHRRARRRAQSCI